MRDPKRIDQIIPLLAVAWRDHPEFRLGQLLCNLLPDRSTDLFHIEDDKWEKLLRAEIAANGNAK